MELKKILIGLDNLKAKGNLDIDIKNIECDSRKVTKDTLFVAITGYDVDGHEFIDDAINNGATAVIVENVEKLRNSKKMNNATIIVTDNSRHALAIASCNFYDNPSRKFKLIGITGTKGKTTTTYMIKTLLEAQGKKVGLIGTIENFI